MIIVSVIFIAIASFLIGFVLGIANEPNIKPIKVRLKKDKDYYGLDKEYQNFLSYDGSEQE